MTDEQVWLACIAFGFSDSAGNRADARKYVEELIRLGVVKLVVSEKP